MEARVEHFEMHQIRNGNDGAARVQIESEDCPDGAPARAENGPETKRLLENVDTTNGNAAVCEYNPSVDIESQGDSDTNQKKSILSEVRDELNQKVKKIKLWVVIIGIFVVIAVVILASLALCRVVYHDPDEKYDSSQFEVQRNLTGSFRLSSVNFTEDLLSPASSERQQLTQQLQKKLDDLYRNSSALGRYFSRSEVYDFSGQRVGSVTAWFRLLFLMPEAEADQLTRFTLSREVVRNVLRQFLFDQEPQQSDHTYMDPSSLHMSE